jgi:hypothetical protein
MNSTPIISLRNDFLKGCGREYDFPTASGVDLFRIDEEALLRGIERFEGDRETLVRALEEGLDWSDCYSLVILGLRVSVSAARGDSQSSLQLAMALIIAGCQRLDYRDTLRAFSVLEDCADRTKCDIKKILESWGREVPLGRVEPIVEDFFEREKTSRRIDSMGIVTIGSGRELQFRSSGFN